MAGRARQLIIQMINRISPMFLSMFPVDPLMKVIEGVFLRHLSSKPTRSEVQSELFNQIVGNEYCLQVPDRRKVGGFNGEEVFQEHNFSVTNVRVEPAGSGLYSRFFENWHVGVVVEFETDGLLKYDAIGDKDHMETWLRRLLLFDDVEVFQVQLYEPVDRNPKLVLIFDNHDIFIIKNALDKFRHLIGEYFSREWQALKYSVVEHDEPLPLTWRLQSLAIGVAEEGDDEDLKERASEDYLERIDNAFHAYAEVSDMPEPEE